MPPTDADEVLAADDARYRAMERSDLAALDRLCADELSYAHSSGVRDTKAEYLGTVASGYYRYHRIDHPVERIEVVGGTAIVVGRDDRGPRGRRRREDDRQPGAGRVDAHRRRLATARPRPHATAGLSRGSSPSATGQAASRRRRKKNGSASPRMSIRPSTRSSSTRRKTSMIGSAS